MEVWERLQKEIEEITGTIRNYELVNVEGVDCTYDEKSPPETIYAINRNNITWRTEDLAPFQLDEIEGDPVNGGGEG